LLQLEKYGGANEAAEITLYKDMKLELKLKAGTYTLYAIPERKLYYNY
jgi:hypothetical protein